MPKNEIVKIINYTQIVRPLYFQRIVFHGVDVMVSVNFDFLHWKNHTKIEKLNI